MIASPNLSSGSASTSQMYMNRRVVRCSLFGIEAAALTAMINTPSPRTSNQQHDSLSIHMPAEHIPACVAEQFILAAMERLAALCLIGSLLASVGLTGSTHSSNPGVSCQSFINGRLALLRVACHRLCSLYVSI
jgi:hypothetical protein